MRFLTCILVAALLAPVAPAAAQFAGSTEVAGDASGVPLHPGDAIRLRIWQEPELSGEFTVDEEGDVVLPKIGRVNVNGVPPEVLEQQLIESYQKFLIHSSIEVRLLRRVQVLGAVREPGLYPVDATMTISDALALAGGTTSEGNPRRVELVRDGERIEGVLSVDMSLANAAIRSGDQLFVPERSWLSRNTGVMATGISAATGLLIALFTR